MFSRAYEIASSYTFPVITSIRYFDKSISCGIGSFVVLNPDGWIVTAAHIVNPLFQAETDKAKVTYYREAIKAIEDNPSLSEKLRRKQKNSISFNQKWITNISFWWGVDGVSIDNFKVNQFKDLAIGKLNPFDPDSIKTYPVIKNPKDMKYGTSLCKLGFPFHTIHASFIEETGNFFLPENSLPIPRFPIEGIYTRDYIQIDPKDNNIKTKFIETSSPGLRGQSGGAIFDTKGTLWAIQSHTIHLELGFNPSVIKNNKAVEENQFLNVGLGVHPEVLISFLRENQIEFSLSD